MQDLHRGQYRFREPLDAPYEFYILPSQIDAKCTGCGCVLIFFPAPTFWKKMDEVSGGYRFVQRPITGVFKGRGACAWCGKIVSQISWPDDAYYKIPLVGGDLWVWNKQYLPALRAKISGDRFLERKIRYADGNRMNGYLLYFFRRIPKHILLKRNREYILKKIDQYLG